jgi:hypothetical protein
MVINIKGLCVQDDAQHMSNRGLKGLVGPRQEQLPVLQVENSSSCSSSMTCEVAAKCFVFIGSQK